MLTSENRAFPRGSANSDKAIVTVHGGTVEAVNLPDGGACFIVAIPSLPPGR
jgi:signal transduction histidine kinase